MRRLILTLQILSTLLFLFVVAVALYSDWLAVWNVGQDGKCCLVGSVPRGICIERARIVQRLKYGYENPFPPRHPFLGKPGIGFHSDPQRACWGAIDVPLGISLQSAKWLGFRWQYLQAGRWFELSGEELLDLERSVLILPWWFLLTVTFLGPLAWLRHLPSGTPAAIASSRACAPTVPTICAPVAIVARNVELQSQPTARPPPSCRSPG